WARLRWRGDGAGQAPALEGETDEHAGTRLGGPGRRRVRRRRRKRRAAGHTAARGTREPGRQHDRVRWLADAAQVPQRDRRAPGGTERCRAVRPLAHGRDRGDRPRRTRGARPCPGGQHVRAGARPCPLHHDLCARRRRPRRPHRVPAGRRRIPRRPERREHRRGGRRAARPRLPPRRHRDPPDPRPRAARSRAPRPDTALDGVRSSASHRGTGAGRPVLLARTGYTGEDGFELFTAAADAEAVWTALATAGSGDGLVPAGLAARDTLRLEAGMALYGNELSTEVTPFDAGLGRVVALDKPGDFVGRAALAERAQAPPRRVLAGLL